MALQLRADGQRETALQIVDRCVGRGSVLGIGNCVSKGCGVGVKLLSSENCRK